MGQVWGNDLEMPYSLLWQGRGRSESIPGWHPRGLKDQQMLPNQPWAQNPICHRMGKTKGRADAC